MKARYGYKFEDLSVGMSHEICRVITQSDIELFAQVSGDHNPLHMDEAYAKKTPFGQRIAHGALTASYISSILGNDMPGPGSIFIGLSMRFKRPVFIGSEVTVRTEITQLQTRGNRVTLSVSCHVNGKVVINGEALVTVPGREA